MLKRIAVTELRLGMFVQEFCGSWMEHPFWRTSFSLHDGKDLDAILASSIKEVWIDSSKGLDVGQDAVAIDPVESNARAEAELLDSAVSRGLPTRVPAAQELERASSICRESKRAVMSMFEEARLGKAVDVAGARELVEDISASVTRNPGALISLARLKSADDYTYMHSVAVCAMMVALAQQLELDESLMRSIGLAGLLHDLGKAVIPHEILNKPGKLTDAEFAIMKNHPVRGHAMLLGNAESDPIALEVCLHHHEKTDGSGYPEQLNDQQISLYSKMGAVCDVYDAITSNRPYKTGWDPSESLRKMAEWSAGHFDLRVFHAFVKSLGIYPVGSLVRLTSGLIGVVTEQSQQSLTVPTVKVFYSTKSDLRIPPREIDLSSPACSDRIMHREDPAHWRFADLNELWSGIPSHW